MQRNKGEIVYQKQELENMLNEFESNLIILKKVYENKCRCAENEEVESFEKIKKFIDEKFKKIFKKTSLLYGGLTVSYFLLMFGVNAISKESEVFDKNDIGFFSFIALAINILRQMINVYDYQSKVDFEEDKIKKKVLEFKQSSEMQKLASEIALNEKWINAIKCELDNPEIGIDEKV